MTVHRNPRNMLAILVSSTLYLPSGRPVPADDVAGWEPSDDEPEDADPACYAAAMAHQRQIDALGPTKPAPRDLPTTDPPKPYRPDPGVAAFQGRCAAMLRDIGDRPGVYRDWCRERLPSLAAQAQRGGVSADMVDLLDQIEHSFDPVVVADADREARELAAWVRASMVGDDMAYLLKRLEKPLMCADLGYVSKNASAALREVAKRKRKSDAMEARYA